MVKKKVPSRAKAGPASKKNIRINGSAVTRDVDPADFLEQSMAVSNKINSLSNHNQA